MSIEDCLRSAAEQGSISAREADELGRYYNARFGAKKRAGLDDATAAKQARDEVTAELREEALENQRRLQLTEAKRKELETYFQDFRDIKGRHNLLDAAMSKMVHYGYSGTSSMQGRENAIMSLVHAELADVMHRFRRTGVTGQRRSQADLPELVRALSGEKADDPELKALAGAMSSVQEKLRQRFNAAGGNIPVRQDFDYTHKHDAQKMLVLDKDPARAKEIWKQKIRPLLDVDAMKNPRTGEKIGTENIDASLDYVWSSIVSDGWAHRKPETRRFGSGAIHSKYQDSRFLEFKDSDSWLAYNKDFGDADVISTIFNQFKNLSADIAALETFGPNPEGMVEWMKQLISVEFGKQTAGDDGWLKLLTKSKKATRAQVVDYRLDSLWTQLRGRDTVWTAPGKVTADVRNVATSAMLGSTSILAAATDPFISAASRALAGLPVVKGIGGVVKDLAKEAKAGGSSLQMARRGILWEDYLHTMNQEARFADQVFGSDWSKTLVDRALTINGLKPVTAARKRVEAAAWQDELGELASKSTDWIDMPDLLKRAMEGFGITADDWHKMRAGVDLAGFLSPVSVLKKTDDIELAEKLAELISQWGERSVPTANPRLKSTISGTGKRGTGSFELVEFATQFLSFGLSFTARQLEAFHIMASSPAGPYSKLGRGIGYSGGLAIGLTIGAMAYSQIQALNSGKEPEEMSASFIAQSFVKGGGGGLFADFVARSESRFGQSFAESLTGPGVAFMSDSFDLTIGSLFRLLRGEEQNVGRKVSNYAGRYTPVLSSHPATRLLWRRWFVDTLQWGLDPDADKSFAAKRRRAEYWWRPGESAPDRAPLSRP